MSRLPSLFTRGLPSQPQNGETNSPAEQRDDAKRNLFKSMRALPTQHYWNVYFDRQPSKQNEGEEYKAQLEQLGTQIESVQDFWRYNNNTPIEQLQMRESIYLFKTGFRPIWEDRRNILGGSWTLRVPKAVGPDVWNQIQLLAIGEQLQSVLDETDDQLCGVGLSVRFNCHLISIWNRDASKQKSIDNLIACVMEQLAPDLRPKPEHCYYKKHSEHPGFNPPPELQAVLDSQKRAQAMAAVPEQPSE